MRHTLLLIRCAFIRDAAADAFEPVLVVAYAGDLNAALGREVVGACFLTFHVRFVLGRRKFPKILRWWLTAQPGRASRD